MPKLAEDILDATYTVSARGRTATRTFAVSSFTNKIPHRGDKHPSDELDLFVSRRKVDRTRSRHGCIFVVIEYVTGNLPPA